MKSEMLLMFVSMDSHTANKHMLTLGLDPKSIRKILSDVYADLLNDRKWSPAKRPSDSAKVPASYLTVCGLVDFGATSVLAPLIASLQANVSSGTVKTKKTSPCNICGKLGHWARECTEKVVKKPAAKPGGKPKDDSKYHGWKKVAPAPGKSQSKKTKTENSIGVSSASIGSQPMALILTLAGVATILAVLPT